MFGDLAGFTGLTERLAPAQLLYLLHEFMGAVSAAVAATGGCVDKNRPTPLAEHPAAALRAALAASRAIALLGPRLRAVGLPPLAARFGVHCGPALVGTVGTAARLSYTCIGDVPNVASRLESLNRRYGTVVLASGEAAGRAGPSFLVRPLDSVLLKARPSVRGLAPRPGLTGRGRGAQGKARPVEACEAALSALRRRDFAGAVGLAQAAARAAPGDLPTALLLARARAAARNPEAFEPAVDAS
eukprot:tig00001415_g8673.t1